MTIAPKPERADQRVGQWLARICLFISAICLTGIMCLTVVEVVGRYGFNAPVFGKQDIARFLLACSIFFAFPVVTLRNEQIYVDLLDKMFSPNGAFWRDRMIGLLISVALITMGYWLYLRAEKTLSRGITSDLLFLPKYPLIYFIAAVVFLTGLIVGLHCVVRIISTSKAPGNARQ